MEAPKTGPADGPESGENSQECARKLTNWGTGMKKGTSEREGKKLKKGKTGRKR